MPLIILKTCIKAKPDIVFDLARSVNLHLLSTKRTNEKAIAGKTSGLMELHDTVTWRARHLGFYQTLSTKITAYNRPTYFADEMVKGAFKSFKHEHFFDYVEGATLMTDVFNYTSPLGLVGKIFDHLFLKKYMTEFLLKRNEMIKSSAECDNWTEILQSEI